MARSKGRTGRLVAWALALTLAVVSSATCLLGADMTEAQKACCAAMKHDCGAMGIEKDCCSAKSPNLTSLTSGTLTSLLVVPDLVAVNLSVAELTPSILPASAAFDSNPPRSSSRPTHLFVSVFRI